MDDVLTGAKAVGEGNCFLRTARRDADACHQVWCKAVVGCIRLYCYPSADSQQSKVFDSVDEEVILGEFEFMMYQL